MAKPRKIATPPQAAKPEGEPSRHLARFKASLVKRRSHSRMNELYDQLDLATRILADPGLAPNRVGGTRPARGAGCGCSPICGLVDAEQLERSITTGRELLGSRLLSAA
jgi:hypothetical protein